MVAYECTCSSHRIQAPECHIHMHNMHTFSCLLGYGADSALSEPPRSRRRTLPRTVPVGGGKGHDQPWMMMILEEGLYSEWQTVATE